MSKKTLRSFADIPYGGLISYPDMKSEKLFHIMEKHRANEHEPMGGTIGEHIPFDEVIQDSVKIRQSICSHIAGDKSCPDMVFHHETCDCCGQNNIDDKLELIQHHIIQSEDNLFNELSNRMDEMEKKLKRFIKKRR